VNSQTLLWSANENDPTQLVRQLPGINMTWSQPSQLPCHLPSTTPSLTFMSVIDSIWVDSSVQAGLKLWMFWELLKSSHNWTEWNWQLRSVNNNYHGILAYNWQLLAWSLSGLHRKCGVKHTESVAVSKHEDITNSWPVFANPADMVLMRQVPARLSQST